MLPVPVGCVLDAGVYADNRRPCCWHRRLSACEDPCRGEFSGSRTHRDGQDEFQHPEAGRMPTLQRRNLAITRLASGDPQLSLRNEQHRVLRAAVDDNQVGEYVGVGINDQRASGVRLSQQIATEQG